MNKAGVFWVCLSLDSSFHICWVLKPEPHDIIIMIHKMLEVTLATLAFESVLPESLPCTVTHVAYPLVNEHDYGQSPFWMGKLNINRPCSMAMSVDQRVHVTSYSWFLDPRTWWCWWPTDLSKPCNPCNRFEQQLHDMRMTWGERVDKQIISNNIFLPKRIFKQFQSSQQSST